MMRYRSKSHIAQVEGVLTEMCERAGWLSFAVLLAGVSNRGRAILSATNVIDFVD